jgi:hypothetical protein
MTSADTAIRAIIRASAWRSVRALPAWVSFVILAAAILWGGR